jgi:hypothetical protein
MKLFNRVVISLSLLVAVGCGDSGGSNGGNNVGEIPPPEPEYSPISNPVVSLPPDIGSPFSLERLDLSTIGYEEREYFVSGTATAFTNVNELSRDGMWEVEPLETADYTTRILVRRPVDPDFFNGRVLVEWMNVSAGFDNTPEWNNAHVEITRKGYVWVGVTAQSVGIYGRTPAIAPFHLKAINAERYDALEHPGDSFSYDIFSQVAQAIRNPVELDVLNGLVPQVLIGAGESQSAFRLTTYVNAIHPLFNPYDGYLIHSRGEYAMPLAQEPQVTVETPPEVLIRTDLNVPVLTFQSETDLLRGTLSSVNIRQDDTDMLRLWEVAGTAHADAYISSTGWADTGVDPAFAAVVEEDSVQGFIQCDLPMNSGHAHYVFNAALDAMVNWIIDGTPPPAGDLLEVDDDLQNFKLDPQGNVLGGIRTPYVDAPAAILSGLGQSGDSFCGLFGTTELFSAEQMANLYVDEAGYVSAVSDAADAAVEAGFLLRSDADLIVAWAPSQWRSQSGQ